MQTVNVLIVGLGGQGVVKASQALAEALVLKGFDVKQSEVHGMSQRGGSVTTEVRFGSEVRSPLAGEQEADFVVALDEREGRRSMPRLRPGSGRLVDAPAALMARLDDPRNRNMAVLGRLSRLMDVEESYWRQAIERVMPAKTLKSNLAAFEAGRAFDQEAEAGGGRNNAAAGHGRHS
ncbi:MAG TPA: 2-oxoacid:acceptor oxidoreductase family protein [Candidatus Brocadiia bacterium]|nr:2-oxoacid:acceptor oxidoreductase family protein [Candidatus Brocadiia bacterium]